jgi:hypothetical protein
MSPAAPTPTPTPIFAPVDSPLVSTSVPGAAGIGVSGASGAAMPVCIDEGVDEAAVSDDSSDDVRVLVVVVVAETNRLLSDDCSWTWIA